MAVPFSNILNLYGRTGYSYLYNEDPTAVDAQSSIFMSNLDTDRDGEISLSEYEAFLTSVGFEEGIAARVFADADTDGNGSISESEFNALLTSFDADSDSHIDFEEALNFNNAYNDPAAGNDIDVTTEYDEYRSMFNVARTHATSFDANRDNIITEAEIEAAFNTQGMDDSAARAANVFNLFNDDGDSELKVEEFFDNYLAWDTDQDGTIDYADEAREYQNLLPGMYRAPQDNIEGVIQYLLKTYNEDGNYELNTADELEAFIVRKLGYMPGYPDDASNALLGAIDSNSDNSIDFEELVAAYRTYDTTTLVVEYDEDGNEVYTDEGKLSFEETAGADGMLSFSELMRFNNNITPDYADVPTNATNPDADIDRYEYMSLLQSANSMMRNYDYDADGVVDIDDLTDVLETYNIDDGGATASAILGNLDEDGDGEVTFQEFFGNHMQWDTDHDGTVEYAEGEGRAEYMDLLPGVFRVPQDGIEQLVQQIFISADGYNDFEVSRDEYADYISANYKFPATMADELIAQNDTDGNGNMSFEEMVATYRTFDTITVDYQTDGDGNYVLDGDGNYIEIVSAGADGNMSYEEAIAFQNTLMVVQIDTLLITDEQYAGLYQMAGGVINSMDDSLDGEISVEEYRSMLKTQYTGSGIEAPEYLAENFVRMFDLDKNGTVNYAELINKYAEFDTDANGVLNSDEKADLEGRLEDTKLWDTVDADIMNVADLDNNNKLSIEEYTHFVEENEMPTTIVDDAFTLYDADLDGFLSRLELMETYSRYDDNIENNAYIQDLIDNLPALEARLEPGTISNLAWLQNIAASTTGEYLLYDGDKDGNMDTDERLQMYQDLAELDYGVTYTPDEDHKNQYATILDTQKDFISQTDFDDNGLLSPEEYSNYLLDQGLPAYMADNAVDNAIVNYDLNDDDSLDFIEWVQVNLDYDANQDGELDLDEVLEMCEDLSGITLNADDTNMEQYSLLYDTANTKIENYDLNNDNILQANEIEGYMEEFGLSATVAQDFVDAYNTSNSADDGLDSMELLDAYADHDINNNGILEFEEEFDMYDDIFTNLQLGIDAANAEQFRRINETTNEIVQNFDFDNNKSLNRTELEAYFADRGMSATMVDGILASYDLTPNTPDLEIDVLEMMKMYQAYDANDDGVLDDVENITMLDALNGGALAPFIANTTQITNLEANIDSLIAALDDDMDLMISATEMHQLMEGLGLPDYIGDEFVLANDVDGDGSLNKLEYMRAQGMFDDNTSGTLELNEELTMYGQTANIDLVPSTVGLDQIRTDQIAQYQGLQNSAISMMAKYDDITDRILNEEELAEYFNAFDLPDYMAGEAIANFDTNGDNGLDMYEWMAAIAEFDANESGSLEFNEQMAMNGVIANPNISFSSAVDASQVQSLYNNAKSQLKPIAGADKTMNAAEVQTWLQDYWCVSSDLAASIVARYGGADNSIDVLELTSALINLDTNSNGRWDNHEIINFIDANDNLATLDNTNATQYNAIYNYTKDQMKNAAGADSTMDAVNVQNWLKDYWGVTLDQATAIAARYGGADNLIDITELTAAIVAHDTNNNGAWDKHEIINFLDVNNNLPTLDDTNAGQYNALFDYAVSQIGVAGSDKEMDATDVHNWLQAYWGVSADLATAIAASYGGADNNIDIIELIAAVAANDTNSNGKWDTAEVINFLDVNNNLPTLDNTNAGQYNALYNYAKGQINGAAGADKLMDGTDVYNWLQSYWGISEDQANAIATMYGGADNLIDVTELTQALINFDTNNNGAWDKNEIINLIDVNNNLPTLDNTNSGQYNALYDNANSAIKGYANGDKTLNAVEAEIMFNDWGLTTDQAATMVNIYGGADNEIDVTELTEQYINFDTNNNGNLETHELINFIDVHADLPELNTSNAAQYNALYSVANKGIKAVAGADKTINAAEMQNWLKDWGLTADQATALVNAHGGADNQIDVIELTNAIINYDANMNGVWDNDELVNFIDIANTLQAANVNGISDINIQKHYIDALNLVKAADKNDKELSTEEYYEFYLRGIGLPEYMAQGLINTYGDGTSIDVLELASAYVGFDANDTGALEFNELMAFYETIANAGGGSFNFENTMESRFRLQNAYNSGISFARNDINYDNIVTASEYEVAITRSFGEQAGTMAANAVATYGNGDGIDAFEWMDAVLSLDENGDGLLSTQSELMNYYESIGYTAP